MRPTAGGEVSASFELLGRGGRGRLRPDDVARFSVSGGVGRQIPVPPCEAAREPIAQITDVWLDRHGALDCAILRNDARALYAAARAAQSHKLSGEKQSSKVLEDCFLGKRAFQSAPRLSRGRPARCRRGR